MRLVRQGGARPRRVLEIVVRKPLEDFEQGSDPVCESWSLPQAFLQLAGKELS